MKITTTNNAIAIFGLCMILLGAGSHAATIEEVVAKAHGLSGRAREEFLVNGAKKEGQIASYTTVNVGFIQPIVGLFQKMYGFLKVNTVRIGGSPIIQRIDTEARTNLHAVDIVATGELGILALMERGLFGKYQTPLRAALRDGFMDKNGYWTVQYATHTFGAYNRNLVKPQELPKSWDDYLEPRWIGRASLDNNPYEWMALMTDKYGEEYGQKYFARLARQDFRLLRGRSLQLQLLAAGEFPVTMVANANLTLDLKKSGAPIDLIRFSPVFLRPSLLLLAARAPHPYAALLYFDFLLSREAQTQVALSTRLPARKDTNPEDRELYEGVSAHMGDPVKVAKDYTRMTALFEKLFGAK